jgi:hypothetical protein
MRANADEIGKADARLEFNSNNLLAHFPYKTILEGTL